MTIKPIKIFFWITFAFAFVILPMNFGVGLIALGLIILPVLVLHLAVGLSLSRIEDRTISIVLSCINLLAFALVRPDGVHTVTGTGLSALLDLIGIPWGYNDRYENYFFNASIILLVIQVILDLRLRKLIRAIR